MLEKSAILQKWLSTIGGQTVVVYSFAVPVNDRENSFFNLIPTSSVYC